MRVAVRMHDVLEKWIVFHGDKVFARLSLDIFLILKSLCLSIASIAFYSFV